MTAIVGMVDTTNDCVWIGGDSCGGDSSNWITIKRKDPKVFYRNPYLFGFTSSFRMGDILKYIFEPPIPDKNVTDITKFIVKEFIPTLRKCFEKEGFMTIKDSKESGGSFLLGFKNRLFTIENNFQVGIPDSYAACGCGRELALGSLHTLSKMNKIDTKNKLKYVLCACETHSAYVHRPFIIKKTL